MIMSRFHPLRCPTRREGVHARPRMDQNGAVLGPVIIVVTLLVIIPVAVCMTGAVVAWALGFFLTSDAESKYEGTEYIELGG
jgi:hypothetical protein